MARRWICTLMGLLFALAPLAWGVGQAGAQAQTPGQVMITDAGGRVHKVMRRMITPEQRNAAAIRAQATRAAAGQQKQKPPVPRGELPTRGEVTK